LKKLDLWGEVAPRTEGDDGVLGPRSSDRTDFRSVDEEASRLMEPSIALLQAKVTKRQSELRLNE
jgi:hypothetical protein